MVIIHNLGLRGARAGFGIEPWLPVLSLTWLIDNARSDCSNAP